MLTTLCAILCVAYAAGAEECDPNGFVKYIATMNELDEPFWYQSRFSSCVDGSKVSRLKVRHMKIAGETAYYVNILIHVRNFEHLETLTFKEMSMGVHPILTSLPSLKSVLLTNNKLPNITQDLYSELPAASLKLSQNNIYEIEDNSFGPSLRDLYLTCNKITNISSAWFIDPSGMIALGLSGNRIRSIPDEFLKRFSSLRTFEIRNNQILTLGANAFVGPADLKNLILSYNNISEVKRDAFMPGNTTLDLFDVQYNKLSFLSDELMASVFSQTIKIWGNPWQCPCLAKLKEWQALNSQYYGGTVAREEDPSCVVAQTFANHCVPFIDPELYDLFVENFKIYSQEFCSI